ncbi:MAG: Glycosyl transferase group 1 [Candidatus Woesebacteria bacterium GW2011_GWB1_41_10]|uniref:Glycosyl transferase group 1 n=2 Tax=Microgenomates group TaxID=1794810 RepID=A0A0G0XFJ4_9BACT|nr:MAG: Glycosyl transferase group 1 [Candidatus Woesebacteria bacterium GW2011_GWB1_41_10]
MKVALVHDFLSEFGGAERVLEALAEIFPKAPIYTAFYKEGSPAYLRFKTKKIITSWAQNMPFFVSKLHSPLRFLAPLIWNSFDFSQYDLVITSSSWYVTKGVVERKMTNDERKTIEICYCHTPPRYLYGYPTAKKQKGLLIKAYALVVNHFMRVYDFESAQKVDYFIANSKEVTARIKKFYRRDSKVIYPPVDTEKFKLQSSKFEVSGDYFLVVSRLVSAKRVDLAVEACAKLGLPLKVVGIGRDLDDLENLARRSTVNGQPSPIRQAQGDPEYVEGSTVQFLGEVNDRELIGLYQNCRAVIFPAEQEDFGIVPVEAQACGKPVIALAQGGVLESVIDEKTGVYFSPATSGSLTMAINKFLQLEKKGVFDPKFIQLHAQKFSKERFKRKIEAFVKKHTSGKLSYGKRDH